MSVKRGIKPAKVKPAPFALSMHQCNGLKNSKGLASETLCIQEICVLVCSGL